MSFQNISMWKLAIIFVVAGAVIVFALLGSSAKNLFTKSVSEDVSVKLKKDGDCIVEPSDQIPRVISNCNYAVGDNLSITYKLQQPTIETHKLKNSTTT